MSQLQCSNMHACKNYVSQVAVTVLIKSARLYTLSHINNLRVYNNVHVCKVHTGIPYITPNVIIKASYSLVNQTIFMRAPGKYGLVHETIYTRV